MNSFLSAPSSSGVGDGRDRTSPWSTTAALWLPAIAIAVLTTRYLRLAPHVWELRAREGLDQSWRAGLAMAAVEHFHFGSEIIFTYGPLGFLDQGGLYFTGTAVLSSLFSWAAHLAVCATVLWSLKRSFRTTIAVSLTLLAIELMRYVGLAESLVVLVAILGIAIIQQEVPGVLRRWMAPGAGILGGIALLMKFDAGLLALVAAVVVVWFAHPGRWHSELRFAAAFVATFLVGWLATGNRVGDLPQWAAGSFQLSSGYSTAMSVSQRYYYYALIPVAAAILVGLGWLATRGLERSRHIALGALGGIVLFGLFKHSFVRQDPSEFFTVCLVLLLALRWRPRLRMVTLGGSAVLFAITLAVTWPQHPLRDADPRWTLTTAARETADLAISSRRDRLVAQSRTSLRNLYRLDRRTLSLLSGRTVHVDPWEISVIWAYPQLEWRPLPVFQSYSAYTTELDRKNAAKLSSPGGPQRILRSGPWLSRKEGVSQTGALDGRNPDFESPEAVLAMLCHYAEVNKTARWQILARVPNRCGRPSPLGSVRASLGEAVRVPQSYANSLVVARVQGLYGSAVQRVQSTLFKASTYQIQLNGNDFRFVPETASGPLLMSAPSTLGYSPQFGFHRSVRSLRITIGRPRLGPSTFSVEFFRIPLAVAHELRRPLSGGGKSDHRR